jgi:hypothetical protein
MFKIGINANFTLGSFRLNSTSVIVLTFLCFESIGLVGWAEQVFKK